MMTNDDVIPSHGAASHAFGCAAPVIDETNVSAVITGAFALAAFESSEKRKQEK